jgi:hypothetical protein
VEKQNIFVKALERKRKIERSLMQTFNKQFRDKMENFSETTIDIQEEDIVRDVVVQKKPKKEINIGTIEEIFGDCGEDEASVSIISLSGFEMTKPEQEFLNNNGNNGSDTEDMGQEIPTLQPNASRKIEPSNQFGDLKTTKHFTKMNSNIMQSITEIFNAEILKFAKRVNAEYPQVPVNGMLTIWCKQQQLPLSTFGIEEGDDVYDFSTEEEPQASKVKVVKKKAAPKKAKASVSEIDSLAQSGTRKAGIASDVNGLSDAEDDVRSSDEEVEHCKPKKAAPKKKEAAKKDAGKECHHMYIKGKNANTKCTTIVKGDGNYCSKHKQKVA